MRKSEVLKMHARGGVPEMEANCGNGIAENEKKKKIVATKLPKIEEKKDATFTIFFTTNYR